MEKSVTICNLRLEGHRKNKRDIPQQQEERHTEREENDRHFDVFSDRSGRYALRQNTEDAKKEAIDKTFNEDDYGVLSNTPFRLNHIREESSAFHSALAYSHRKEERKRESNQV